MLFTNSVTMRGQGAPQDPPDEVVRVNTDLISVPALVVDGHGNRVPGLSKGDFRILDNGNPVEIEYFASGAERVVLLFAFDTSGSTRTVAERQRETALALFSRFGHGSKVAVLRFADVPELVVPFTNEPEAAKEAFLSPPVTGRHTAIFDAAEAAAHAFEGRKTAPNERRIVILISDGLDTVSRVNPRSVISEAKANSVSFYVIHLPLFWPQGGHLVPRPVSKGFRELAEQTGGQYFTVGDARSALDPHAEYDLTLVFKAIEDDLRGQYVLGYYAGEASRATGDRRFHKIAVQLTGERRGLKVKALRDGYGLK
jgi:VWFA-related protein